MATPAETAAMQRALELAAAALGTSNPNPAVGAVVLSADGAVVGEGGTQQVGGAHAEIVALQAAGSAASGGTLVVTLEPCRHVGRTGPCTDAIAAAGVRRVVFAVGDPHGDAAGGAEVLRAQGVDVESGLLADEAQATLGPWLTAVRRRRPHVTWKYAATLDGRTAAPDGTSRWITGAEARRDVHRLRAASDAVVVGIGTVLADDPQLTVRDVPTVRQPLRVVVDGSARTPLSARILDDTAPTLVAVGTDAQAERVKALRSAGADVLELPRRDARVDLGALLAELFAREALLLLLEGGATLAGSFVRSRLVDRVVGYHAPALLGAGPPVLGAAGVTTIGEAVRLDVQDVTQVGVDVRIDAVLTREGR
ncbi:MAG TPA: bifunctional diaminohydroxyphosphoribosylaminopyrimidine deaminase/5-amino-6-(5-phosphoribosylamino)uracil reductase RibD [Mycobacteriales bacterium]|nr:bifunctional diaminohydroxyphosphoribosylaminopyrimidine deaminase/5-amino-6-(5-phosphoribosylamino)uracil reductase RibD [Mycobacteriales bacterium]